jgi:cell wall-associated NlpC family hydrolase
MPRLKSVCLRFLFIYNLIFCIYDIHAQKSLKNDCFSDSIVDYAYKFIGKPYLYGGSSVNGFDCSGFVSFIYGHFNISTPRSSADYGKIGIIIAIDSCQKGDIILFTGTDLNHSVIGHVGIIMNELGEPVKFIHSSSSKKHQGVVITYFKESAYVSRFIGIRRICQ